MNLRQATMSDAAFLLACRADPGTQAASWSREPIIPSKHLAWVAETLDNPSRVLLIADECNGGPPVGTVRLDRRAGTAAEVSITIAPGERGKGYAQPMLSLAALQARALGITKLMATVRGDNRASLKAFIGAGYAITADRVEMELSL